MPGRCRAGMRVLGLFPVLLIIACSNAHMGSGGEGGGTSAAGGGSGTAGSGTGGGSNNRENCSNRNDDDGDTFIDCADTDCFQDMACFASCLDLCSSGAQICDGTGTRACESDA